VTTAGATATAETAAGRVGIWAFLVSEIMLFGAFLAGYVMTRWGSATCRLGAPAWPRDGHEAGLALATLNTLALITSSFTMVRACLAAAGGRDAEFRRWLGGTIGLGAVFLAVKAVEYALKISHGLSPNGAAVLANPGLGVFVSYYFAVTGLHGVHVLAGLIWLAALAQASRRRGAAALAGAVEYAGLYWHFVDVVWVFLFPLFYLV
jgi:cytochrome c oxidase subunit 3